MEKNIEKCQSEVGGKAEKTASPSKRPASPSRSTVLKFA